MRFSEVTVRKSDDYDIDDVADMYRTIVQLALELEGTVKKFYHMGV